MVSPSPQNPPHVAILPLGTGNDLARTLGWGKGYDNEDINDIIRDVKHAQLSLLDRWVWPPIQWVWFQGFLPEQWNRVVLIKRWKEFQGSVAFFIPHQRKDKSRVMQHHSKQAWGEPCHLTALDSRVMHKQAWGKPCHI